MTGFKFSAAEWPHIEDHLLPWSHLLLRAIVAGAKDARSKLL